MTFKAALLVSIAFVSLASAQRPVEDNVDRVLHFTSIESAQEFQEIGTVVSRITDIQQAAVDTGEKALVLHGTAGQIALAEWLFTELDKPTGAQALQGRNWAKHEYNVSNSGDDVVRVFYLTNADTVQRLQEMATVVRSIGDIRRLFTYNALRAVAVRGTPDQAALAEFLFNELDKPDNHRDSATHIYRPGGAESVLKVFYLPNTKTVQEFQEMAMTVRTITNARRMFTYNAPRAVAVRGSAEQIELADWLFNELDKPANPRDANPHEYHILAASDDVVRVFYLTHAQTMQRLHEIAIQAQSLTHQQTALPYAAARAVIVRGTAAEIAQADRLIKERNR